MNYKTIITILRRIVFVFVLIFVLVYINAVLERKTIIGPWDYSIKVGGFKNEPENSFDVIGIGSSHMYCTLNPVYLYEQTGLRSYVLATQQQPPIASYYYAKEAFLTQSPKVLIVEAFMFALDAGSVEEGIAHDAIDPFPNSVNKLKMIHDMEQVDAKENYYLNFLKYHSRWKELTAQDFDFDFKNATDPYHGYVLLADANPCTFESISYENVIPVELDPEHLQILLEIKKLAENNNAKLLLLFAPDSMNVDVSNAFKTLHLFANQHQIETLDLNLALDELSFNANTDFYDPGHLNVYGAEKASMHIGQKLINNNYVSPQSINDRSLWDLDIEVYNASKNVY